MLRVDMEKLKLAQKEITNAGLKGEKAIEKLKSIEVRMNELMKRKENDKN